MPTTAQLSEAKRARAAAATAQRRASIRERGREIITADKVAIQRSQLAARASAKYPKTDVLALKAIFDEYDRDGDGALGRDELSAALRRRKVEAQRWSASKNKQERQAMAGIFLYDFADSLFDSIDANDDALVQFSEVLRIVYPRATPRELQTMNAWANPAKTEKQLRHEQAEQEDKERLEMLHAMFAAYDRDGDGKVSITEFRMAMLDHENWDEVDEMFDQYDKNGNGEVDFDEFCAIVSPDTGDD